MDHSSEAFDPFSGGDEEVEEGSVNFSAVFNASFDTSFESSSFHFPATANSTGMWEADFSFDETSSVGVSSMAAVPSSGSAIATVQPKLSIPEENPSVHIALHEEMVCLHNSISRASSCTLKGTIQMKSSKSLKEGTFFLVVKDPRKHIENLSMHNTQSHFNIDELTRDMKIHRNFRDRDTVFQIHLPKPTTTKPAQLLSYTCPRMLTPVPIVVQNKVRIASNLCRVVIMIRSVPSNENHLTNISILMAVPPTVNGHTVRMSHEGGVWDSFKRLIVWSIEELNAGSTLTLQLLFEFNRPVDEIMVEGKPSINFPVLVRCGTKKGQLSNILVEAKDLDSSSSNVEMTLSRTFRVLYRKV